MNFCYGNNTSTYLIDLLKGLNEIKYMKCFSEYTILHVDNVHIDRYYVNIISSTSLAFNSFRSYHHKKEAIIFSELSLILIIY